MPPDDRPPNLEPDDSPGEPETPQLATADRQLVETLRTLGEGNRIFRRFRLTRELGRGGMGVVWLAFDERLRMEVALKFLPSLVASDDEALEVLRQEIAQGLKLTHPGIVRIYDLHEDADEKLAA